MSLENQCHDKAAGKVTVTIYWIRHAFSCANALKLDRKLASATKDQKAQNKVLYDGYVDPQLSDYGLNAASSLGQIAREKIAENHPNAQIEESLVFSSAMVRTMETALASYPDATITPIPHVAEKTNLGPNLPLATAAQKQRLEALDGSYLGRLNYEELEADERKWQDVDLKSNYEEFKTYFPDLLYRRLGNDVGDEVPVVLFGHAAYMRDNLACGYEPKNNEVFVQKYEVQWGQTGAALEPGECTPLFPKEEGKFSKPPVKLCEDALVRCKEVNGEKLPLPELRLDADCQACKAVSKVNRECKDVP